MRKQKEQENTNEIKRDEVYSCSKCWANYLVYNKKELARNLYIVENIYFSLPDKKMVVVGQVARCQFCGTYKMHNNKIYIFNYNGQLLHDLGVSLDDLRNALINWPIDRRIILDPSKELKYNGFEPKENETFDSFRERYKAEVARTGKWL